MLTRKAVILAKIQPTPGVDAVPTAAADSVLCSVPQVTPEGEKIIRDFVRSSLSPMGHVIGIKSVNLKFDVELKGSGTAGTAPEIGPLLRACGLDETIVESTSVEYTPISEGFEMVTIYFYRDGLLHKLLDARGTFSLDLSVGQYGVLAFDFTGIYATPTDVPLVDGVYNNTQPPLFLAAGLSLGGYTPIFSKLQLALNNQVVKRLDANSAAGLVGLEIIGRTPGGSLDPEAVLVATKDFWSAWENGTKETLTCVAGSAAGNKCTVAALKIQYDSLAYGDRDGIVTYDLPFTCCLTTGDDELSLKFE